jgi:hypothetical protein
MRAALLLSALAIALLMTACGKKGSPSAPGPPDEVIFPRSYPRQ